jgi:tetratricopeptide (TPR) repeat protein
MQNSTIQNKMKKEKQNKSKNQPSPQKTVGRNKPVDNKKAIKWCVLIIALLPFVLYFRSLTNKYAIDDTMVIFQNEQIHKGLKALPEIFTTHYSDYIDDTDGKRYMFDYRPIVKASFAIEYELFGEKPIISHFINILLYSLCCVLLFFLMLKLFKKFSYMFSFLISLMFLAHPVHTEIICNLKNRDELLYLIFALLAVFSFIKYAETKKIKELIIGSCLFVFSYLSKSNAMVFVLAIPLILYFFTEYKPKILIITVATLLFLFIILYLAPVFLLPKPERFTHYFENPLMFESSIWLRIGTGFLTLIFYLRLLIFPHPLGFYYGYDQFPIVGPGNLWAIFSMIIFTVLLIFAIIKFKEKHILSFSILFFIITISMFSNFLRPVMGIVGERFLFAPSIAFCIALVYLLSGLFKKSFISEEYRSSKSGPFIFVLLIIFSLYSYKSWDRNKAWKDSYTLYKTDIDYLNKSFKANMLYGTMVLYQIPNNIDKKDELYQTGEKYLKRALEIYPKAPSVWNNYARIFQYYYQMEDSALAYYNQARLIDSTYFAAYYNLGDIYFMKKDYKSAIYFFQKSIKFNPENEYGYNRLMDTYFKKNDTDEAFDIADKYMKKFPKSPTPYDIIGNFYSSLADSADAVKYWNAALKRSPDNMQLKNKINSFSGKK